MNKLLIALAALGIGAYVPHAAAEATGVEAQRQPSREQKREAKEIPQTLILRVNAVTGAVEAAHVKEALPPRKAAHLELDGIEFTPVTADTVQAGLTTQAFSWSFWFPSFWSRPAYGYNNYNYYYRSYYNYGYSGWNYYYYGWPYSGYYWW